MLIFRLLLDVVVASVMLHFSAVRVPICARKSAKKCKSGVLVILALVLGPWTSQNLIQILHAGDLHSAVAVLVEVMALSHIVGGAGRSVGREVV